LVSSLLLFGKAGVMTFGAFHFRAPVVFVDLLDDLSCSREGGMLGRDWRQWRVGYRVLHYCTRILRH
jgi:hypothetical protein